MPCWIVARSRPGSRQALRDQPQGSKRDKADCDIRAGKEIRRKSFARAVMGFGIGFSATPSRGAYLISPASLGSVRLISGMQMMSSSPANSASIYGT